MDSLPLRWGRARVGADKMNPFWVPSLHPLPRRGGEIFSDRVFSIMDSLVTGRQRVDAFSYAKKSKSLKK